MALHTPMPLIEAAREGRVQLLTSLFGGGKAGKDRPRRATAGEPAFRAFSSSAEIISFAERHNARRGHATPPPSTP